MKTFLRILKWVAIVLVGIVALIFIAGAFLYNKSYTAPTPEIHLSKDSAVLAHGKHLVFVTAHCAECHFKPGDSMKVANGEDFDIAGGGFPFKFPGGAFYAANISSDKETGIGNLRDGEIAKAIRYGVKHDGSALIPAMEYQNMSNEDLTAVISYLRTVAPVKFKVPPHDFNLLGKAIIAFFIRPGKPDGTPPVKVTPDTTVEYGKYIAKDLSNCRGCHTLRDMNTGKYTGKELAGGMVEPLSGNRILVAPNLTPDPKTGLLYNWTFDQFKNRFKAGKVVPESIMPWGQFKHLDDVELKAIWKYLHSVAPVQNATGPAIQNAKS